jgi:hypothetical protein
MLAACFCHSRESQVEYNFALIKVDWLAALIAVRVVGTVFVIFLGVGVQFAQPSSQWEARAEMSEALRPIRIKETWTKYTSQTLLSQLNLALTVRNTLFML